MPTTLSEPPSTANRILKILNATPQAPSDPSEHPQGAEIRKLVEHYFSDENLPNDQHLRALCCDHLNVPVSLNEIFSWRSLRHFKPRSLAIESLNRSKILKIVLGPTGKQLIQRRVPWDDGQGSSCQICKTDAGDKGSNLVPINVIRKHLKEGYICEDGKVRRISQARKAVRVPFSFSIHQPANLRYLRSYGVRRSL